MSTENLLNEDVKPASEEEVRDGIKINVESQNVSASTLLDFFNQLQVFNIGIIVGASTSNCRAK